MKELNPPGLLGTAIGTLNAASYLTVAVVTTAAGAIMDRYESAATRTEAAVVYPREAYLSILGLCLALSALAFLLAAAFMRETRGRALWKPPASVQPAGDLP
jgi:hypothetical protein